MLASFALGGCELLGGQTGQSNPNGPAICNGSTTSLSTDAVSALGVSADDLLASLPPLGGKLHIYRPDQVDNLTLSLGRAAAARQVIDTGFPCSNRLEVDAVATLLTDDGLFNASLPVTLEAEASNNWRLHGKRRLSEIAGSYDWSVFPLDQWQDPSLQVQAQTSAGGSGATVTGSLSLVGDDPDPADGATPVAAAVGDWMSAGPVSFGGSGGTAEFGGVGGGTSGGGSTAGAGGVGGG